MEPTVEVFVLDHLRVDTRLVRVRGALDDPAAAEVRTLVELMRASLELDMLVLDLTELTEFGPSAVEAVVLLAVDLGYAGVGLRLVARDSLVGSALADAGVRVLFDLHGSIDEALALR